MKTKKTKSITLSEKDVCEILQKALKKHFPNVTKLSINYKIESDYSDSQFGDHYFKEVEVSSIEESKE